jgi:predicted dehydrogenase
MGRSQALSFGKVEEASIVAVYDVIPAQAEKLASEIGATPYSDLDALLAEVDFVVICTPPTQRLELFRKALAAKVAMLLEKPLAGDYASAQEIAALTNASDVPVRLGYCHRFVPAVQEILGYKTSGIYGALRFLSQSFICGKGTRALKESWMSDPALSGGGVVMDTLCHSIDLTQYLGGRYEREMAVLQSSWEGRGETAASIQALTEEGVLVEVTGAWDYPVARFDLRAIFAHADIYYRYGDPFITVQKEDDSAPSEVPIEGFGGRVAAQAQAFIDLLNGKPTVLCTVEEALSVSRVTEAAYSSK